MIEEAADVPDLETSIREGFSVCDAIVMIPIAPRL